MTSDALLAAATRVLGIALPDGSPRDLNEANTRAFVIDPIIAALGYAGPDQIELEVPVGRSGQSLDYVLTAHGTRIAVEAKSLKTPLADREASQLVGYIAQEGIRWAILTNGLDWHIFDNEVSGKWKEKRVATIDLPAAHRESRLGDALRPLTLFAHDVVGKSDADLSAWSQRERARSHIDELLGNPGSSAVRAIVTSMRKGGIRVSPSDVVDLLRDRVAAPTPATSPRHVAEEPAPYDAPAPSPAPIPSPPRLTPTRRRRRRPEPDTGVQFYLFPAGKHDDISGLDHLRHWLGRGLWGLRTSTPRRRQVRPGDQCCFYATGVGIVAYAEITAAVDQEIPLESWPGLTDWSPGVYGMPLRNIRWLPQPIEITPELRGRMDAYHGKDLSRPWPWLVQTTFLLTEHDFNILTGRA